MAHEELGISGAVRLFAIDLLFAIGYIIEKQFFLYTLGIRLTTIINSIIGCLFIGVLSTLEITNS